MTDDYKELHEMAQKLSLPAKPRWYDRNGCPHWQPPPKDLRKYMRKIRCQACGKIFRVCLVHPVYKNYSNKFNTDIPRDWYYGDPPSHPGGEWKPGWWKGGWGKVCSGVTMTSERAK